MTQLAAANGVENVVRAKRPAPSKPKKKKMYKVRQPDPISSQGVLIRNILSLFPSAKTNDMAAFFSRDRSQPWPMHKQGLDLEIAGLSHNGLGIGYSAELDRVVVVPYTLPGDKVRVNVLRSEEYFLSAFPVEILAPSKDRTEKPVCRYFGSQAGCAGCQYMETSYEHQLEIKQEVVRNAYRLFAPDLIIPDVGSTVPSPKTTNYRTKITPHFDVPNIKQKKDQPGDLPASENNLGGSLDNDPNPCHPICSGNSSETQDNVPGSENNAQDTVSKTNSVMKSTNPINAEVETTKLDGSDVGGAPIGFGHVLKNEIVDIEECAIATNVINRGLAKERARVHRDFKQFKRGATLLLREGANEALITDPKCIMEETVGKFVFRFKAGEFFQNNNSILPVVTDYVATKLQIDNAPPKYLVDTYCGCGLFAITCSANAERVLGVEISAQNVEFARSNAALNKVENAEFVVGQAEKIFDKVPKDSSQTSVVIDPPRKGCDNAFLDQLIHFSPARIVYVSCNVHSQARDIAYFVENSNGKYKVESLRGFDFFPQTYHVESVAVLTRIN